MEGQRHRPMRSGPPSPDPRGLRLKGQEARGLAAPPFRTMASGQGGRPGSLEAGGGSEGKGCGENPVFPSFLQLSSQARKARTRPTVLPGERLAHTRSAWAEEPNHSVRRNVWGGRRNPKAGTFPALLSLRLGGGTPEGQQPHFEKQGQSPLTGTYTVAAPSQGRMQPLPWESRGSPQPWNVLVGEEVGRRV